MHENAPVIEAKRRERTGSRYADRIRKQGGLPGIVYGHGETPVPIYADAVETIALIHKGEKVFTLKLDGNEQHVLLKDLQFDYLGTDIIHADFARVDLDERVNMRPHLRFLGDARGLKTAGAVMMHPNEDIEIECTVANLPEEIEVDVSDLDVGETITAADVKLPRDTMILLSDPEMIVAQIVLQKQAETDEESEVSAEGAAQPEVITEKKDEE